MSRLGPLEVSCDAPAYSVVRACQGLGFVTPEDVRWCRLSHVFEGKAVPEGATALQVWGWLFRNQAKEKPCVCGHPLPILETYTFTFASLKTANYLLGQCRHCHTIYWEQG
jgi:hypothetical protein